MQRLPAHVLAALPQATRRTVRAEWSNDGGQSWRPARVSTAEVKPDRTAECRWSASVDLLDAPFGRNGINNVITQVRLWEDVTAPRADPYTVPAGRYVVDRVKQTLRGRGLSLDLLGLEDVIRGASLPVARTVAADTARNMLERLVAEALPDAAVSWRAGVDAMVTLPSIVIDEDRWQALAGGTDSSGSDTGVAPSLGAEVWADARGVIVVGPVPTLDDPVVWRLPYGHGITGPPESEQSAEELVNLWAVSGDAGTGEEESAAIGPVFVWDSDPSSLTYAGPAPVDDPLAPQRLGLPWVRPRVGRYSSPLITTVEQAYTAGRAKLADSLGVQSSLSFTAYSHPGVEPGDVVEVEIEPEVWQRHVIDSCPRTLGAASMTCQTRTSARRL